MAYFFQEKDYRFQELLRQYPNVVNVLDYGFVFDGVTDNSAAVMAINMHLSHVELNSGAGVYFPPAALPALSSVGFVLSSGQAILAAPGTVIFKATGASPGNPLLIDIYPGTSNTLVYGLTLDGGGADFGSSNPACQVYNGCSGVLFDTVTFQNIRGLAINWSTGITNSGVVNCTFTNCGNHWITTQLTADRVQAIAFSSGTGNSGNFVSGCFFNNIGLDAISVGAQMDFLASSNYFDLDDGQITATWADPQPTAFGAAIYAATGNVALTARGNRIISAQGNGIDIGFGGATLDNNTITGCGSAGIGLFGAAGKFTIAENNQISGNAQWVSATFKGGITLSGSLGAVDIEANISTSNPYGIQVVNGTTWDSLYIDADNTLTDNSIAPIFGAHIGYN